MARAKKDQEPADTDEVRPASVDGPQDGQDGQPSKAMGVEAAGGTGGAADAARSEEVMVVRNTEEPVRRGGHILTENGWVVEDAPAVIPMSTPVDPDTEQE